LRIPFLDFATKEALPPLVAAPRLQDFRQVSTTVLRPPALRMFPPNSSAFCSLFAPVVSTFTPTPPLNVVNPSGLQVVPSLMPAYMALRQTPSVPLLQMNVATSMSSLPTFRPAVPVSNFPRPPQPRLQLPSTSSLPSPFQRLQLPNISSLSSSFQLFSSIFTTTNSVKPPPLRLRFHNMSQRSSAPPSVASSPQTVRLPSTIANSAHPAPLQIRLSQSAPYSSAAGDFRCFAISSTKPTVVGSIVSVAVSSATQSRSSTSVSCSQVSSAISTSCSTRRTNTDVIEVADDTSRWTSTDVIDVDEDSSSEVPESDTSDDIAVVSSSSESSTVSAVSPSSNVSRQSMRLIFFQSNNHFQSLHAGVDCLQHIFQYLDISSRLRAAQVCRCWRRMALQQHLVKSVMFSSTNLCFVIAVVIFSRAYCYTAGLAIGIMMSSVCLSICNAVHYGAQLECRQLNVVLSCSWQATSCSLFQTLLL